jgi:hypothetical protein
MCPILITTLSQQESQFHPAIHILAQGENVQPEISRAEKSFGPFIAKATLPPGKTSSAFYLRQHRN